MLNRKFWIIIQIIIALSLIITACAPQTPALPVDEQTVEEVDEAPAQPVQDVDAEPEPDTPKEVRTVIYLSAGTAEVEQDWNEKWVKAFNDSHDDIQIQYELISWSELLPKAAAMIAAGTPPDIAWYAPSIIKEWYLGGLLEPLDDWLASDIEELLPPIKDPSASDIIYNGKYYGMPFCLAGLGVAVRQDILAEAGYEIEDLRSWTWDDMLEIAEAVYDPDNGQYAYQFAFGDSRVTKGKEFFLANGLRDLTDFSDRDAYIEALQMSVNLFPYTPEAQLQWGHADSLTAYMNSIVVMEPQGSFFYGDIKRQAPDIMSDEKTAALPYPRGPRMEQNSAVWYTVGWVMFESSQNKEAAAEVLSFLASKEAVNEWPMNMAPKEGITLEDRIAVSEFGEDIAWWLNDWAIMIDNTVPLARPGYAPMTEINEIFNNVLLDLYFGSITVEEAYDLLKSQIEPILLTE